jgi:hypothetical protein
MGPGMRAPDKTRIGPPHRCALSQGIVVFRDSQGSRAPAVSVKQTIVVPGDPADLPTAGNDARTPGLRGLARPQLAAASQGEPETLQPATASRPILGSLTASCRMVRWQALRGARVSRYSTLTP